VTKGFILIVAGNTTMIITVTTTTTTTVMAMGLTAAISIAAVASLIIFLTARELVSASDSITATRIARFFGIGILPLAMTFVVIVVVKIAGMMA
jgi:hypothetical protein